MKISIPLLKPTLLKKTFGYKWEMIGNRDKRTSTEKRGNVFRERLPQCQDCKHLQYKIRKLRSIICCFFWNQSWKLCHEESIGVGYPKLFPEN